MMMNLRMFWLDTSRNKKNDGFENGFTSLEAVVDTVTLFNSVNECVDVLTDLEKENVLLIVSNTNLENIMPLIHDIPQLWGIFVFCGRNCNYEKCMSQWPKVKGVFTELNSICKAFEQIIKQHEENMIPYSLISVDDADSFITGRHFTYMNRSLMYAYLLKEVFTETDDYNDARYITAFANYIRRMFHDSSVHLEKIKTFEYDFCKHTMIWWYTYDYFLFATLNHAIRTLDIEFILRMGFIVSKLTHHIRELWRQQAVHFQAPFTVYREQMMFEGDFLKLQQTKKGLLVFNSFLTANIDQSTATMFNHDDSELINVLFIMHINPNLDTIPFAALDRNVGGFEDNEKKILFCMHTVFRIMKIEQMVKDSHQTWQVHLTLIADDDPKLVAMNNRVCEETQNSAGWGRLGFLLLAATETNKAEDLFQLLYKEAPNDIDRLKYSSNLGQVYLRMEKFPEAVSCFEKALTTLEKLQPWNHATLAGLYSSIGLVHGEAGEYTRAFFFQHLALNIRENTLPPNDPSLSQSYINLGCVYLNMCNWSLAVSHLEKGLEILLKSVSKTHPNVKNCMLAIKWAKKGMFDEENKRMKQNENECVSELMEINNKTMRRTNNCLIVGRNHFSAYVNDCGKKVFYGLYWLDVNSYCQADLEAELCHIIPLMTRFDNMKDCEDAIQNVVSCTIVLIIAASVAYASIPLLHDLPRVTKIYIYSADYHNIDLEALMKTYDKVAEIVSTPYDLVEKIAEDWEEKETRSLLPFGIVSRWDVSLEWNEPNMLWFKLLISFLTRFDNRGKTAKEDLLEFLRKSYHGNAKQLQDINNFEQTYLAIDAIHWYTRDFCLYRLVNKAFRQGNIDKLYSLRLFIQDLYKQLASLHAEQRRIHQEKKQLLIRSYRGQIMLQSGLISLSSGTYIVTTSFFSTSMNREQAYGFLAGGVASNDQVLVFFVIDANISLKSAPFADITSVSNHYDENEVLYAPGALFRVRSTLLDTYDDVHIIELELCNDDDLPLKNIYDTFTFEHGRDINPLSFSLFLYDMGEYRKAKKFLLRFLNDLKKENINIAMCSHALGRVANGLDDHDVAVLYQEAALDIRTQVISTDFNDLAQICNHLAEGYCMQNRSYLAVEYNDFAIECSLQIEDVHRRNILLSNCYHTDGRIQLTGQRFHQAIRSLNVSLDYRLRSYPSGHPFIAEIYMTIGKTYSLMEQNHEALKMYKMAKNIFLESLPITHPYIGDVLYSLGWIALDMIARGQIVPDSDNFHTNFIEAYDIFHHSLPARSNRFLLAKRTIEDISRAQVIKGDNKSKNSRICIMTAAPTVF